MTKTYIFPDGKKAVFEYDHKGVGKITLECMDMLMSLLGTTAEQTEPQTETIRCKDCVHWKADKSFCNMFHVGTPSDGFCYMAKRMTTGTDCSWK